MQFDMTFDDTLGETAPVSVTSQIHANKTSYFHFYCIVYCSIKANFQKEHLWKPSSGICYVLFLTQ